MNRTKLTAALIANSLLFASSNANAGEDQDICKPSGYTVGFFNGVWNTHADAELGMATIAESLGDEHNDESIRYALFYNKTGSANRASAAEDILETFAQRSREFEKSGIIADKIEYLWEMLFSDERPMMDKLSEIFEGSVSALDSIMTGVIGKSTEILAKITSSPSTEADYRKHNATIDSLAAEKQKLLLIAHSQGNLFVNQAFDYAKTKYKTNSVAALHIAPASPTLRGDYILADIDIIIRGLKMFGYNSVPTRNFFMPTSKRDPSGHMLVGTYMDKGRLARKWIHDQSLKALSSLETPESEGHSGFFTVTMTGDGEGDIDLHTFEPQGTHVFYQNMQGYAGSLDIDNTEANGPEHYYASCNARQLQAGTYSIAVNNFNGPPHKATINVTFAQGGQPLTKVVDTGLERGAGGDRIPLQVMNVVVSRDKDGRWSAKAFDR